MAYAIALASTDRLLLSHLCTYLLSPDTSFTSSSLGIPSIAAKVNNALNKIYLRHCNRIAAQWWSRNYELRVILVVD